MNTYGEKGNWGYLLFEDGKQNMIQQRRYEKGTGQTGESSVTEPGRVYKRREVVSSDKICETVK